MEKIDVRVQLYTEKYGAENIPSQFSYNLSVEQIIYRNEALRTDNRNMYLNFLERHKDLNTDQELKTFDSLAPRIIKLDTASFLAWVTEKGINLVESDISIFDEDAILRGVRLDETHQDIYEVEGSWKELIHNLHDPVQLAKERSHFWILDE